MLITLFHYRGFDQVRAFIWLHVSVYSRMLTYECGKRGVSIMERIHAIISCEARVVWSSTRGIRLESVTGSAQGHTSVILRTHARAVAQVFGIRTHTHGGVLNWSTGKSHGLNAVFIT